MIAFTKVDLPYGWLGNMSAFAVTYKGKSWRTTEALFQALRFDDESIVSDIHEQSSPMAAKMKAKKNKTKMVVSPTSKEDLDNMRLCLRLKVEQHPQLLKQLLATGTARIIEDCSKRPGGSPWGAKLIDGVWVGDNLLGNLWMELREEMRFKKAG